MMGRVKQQGTPIARSNEPKSNPVEAVRYEWTQEQIAQHLAKYPPAKMRLPQKETLYEQMIRPQKVGGQR